MTSAALQLIAHDARELGRQGGGGSSAEIVCTVVGLRDAMFGTEARAAATVKVG
jgi:hypothetical protein